MAVGLTSQGQLYLFYNPEFVVSLTHGECKAVLLHEVNHVVFGHLGAPPPGADERPRAWEYACECTANEYVPYPLPGEPVTLEWLGLPPHESTVARFEQLRRRVDLPSAPPSHHVAGALRSQPAGPHDVLDRSAPYPTELVEQTSGEVGRLDEQTAAGLVSHAGVLPPSLLALGAPDVSSLDWRTLLGRLVGGVACQHSTRRWPSRRRPDLVGIVPGRRRRRERPVVLAAIDTSASMSRDSLRAVAAELQGLLEQGVRVAVVQCDDQVRAHGWFELGDPLERVLGRGGTDLRPPFGATIGRLYRPDLTVYFTDGGGPAPAEAPPRLAVLWVLTGPTPRRPAPWGKAVLMTA